MTSPIIGITVSKLLNKQRFYDRIPSAYSEAIIRAGGLPILIPVEFPISNITKLLGQLDGLLLSGGGDVSSAFYNGESHPDIVGVCEERDQLEIELLKNALKANKPVLGICRGTQLINIALGGTLYAHIPGQFKTDIIHNTPEEKDRDCLVHEVELDPNSKIGRITGQNRITVNSFHHQAIRTVAPGLRVTARATDGLIEAVELPDEPFGVIGVQWHPEDLISIPSQFEIFKAFTAACQR